MLHLKKLMVAAIVWWFGIFFKFAMLPTVYASNSVKLFLEALRLPVVETTACHRAKS